jgi:hypothetical protein
LWPAQLGASLGPIQQAKPARAIRFLGTLPCGPRRFTDSTHQPLYFAGRNCFTPDSLQHPIPSQTRPLPLLQPIPPSARFWPNGDASVWPRLPHAALSHPHAVGHRLWTESSHRVAARRCVAIACRITPPLRLPQCRGQALAAKGPAHCSLMVPACT